MATPRIARVFGAVNIGSFRISAMIAGTSVSQNATISRPMWRRAAIWLWVEPS